jgi:hypothetical protein
MQVIFSQFYAHNRDKEFHYLRRLIVTVDAKQHGEMAISLFISLVKISTGQVFCITISSLSIARKSCSFLEDEIARGRVHCTHQFAVGTGGGRLDVRRSSSPWKDGSGGHCHVGIGGGCIGNGGSGGH